MTNYRLQACASAFAILTALGSASASAQTTQPSSTEPADVAAQETAPSQAAETGPAEIVVTAQKRAERLQDVPISISALNGDAVTTGGVLSLTQIAPRVPGFYGGSAGATRPQLYIRGIGSRQFDAGSEASIGVFVDDIYLGRSAASLNLLRDVERVEVLKGPQGTLYGRNTIGGAINVLTKGPTTRFRAEAEAGIGNYNAYNLFGAISGPIAGDVLLGRLAAWRTYTEGYVRNIQTGGHAQGVDNYGARLRLELRPADRITIGLNGEITRDNGYSFAGESEGNITNPNAVFLAAPGRFATRTPDRYSDRFDGDNFLDRDLEALSLKAEFETGAGTITAITGYRHNFSIDDREFDNTNLEITRQRSDEDSDQFTQELRFTSDVDGPLSLGGKLEWIAGLFYYNDKSNRLDVFNFGRDSVQFSIAGVPVRNEVTGTYRTKSVAAFAQATYHLTDTLDLTLGGRYTRDKKQAKFTGATTRPGVPLVAAPFVSDDLSATFSAFNPRVTLAYQPTRDLNFYASFNQGFKSGGFQYIPFTAAQANVVFEPEKLNAYEIGMKSQFLDRRITFNTAAFLYKYKDLQVLRVVPVAGGGAATLIVNAASSTIKGFEVDTTLRPINNLELNLTYAYTDATYDKFQFNATTDFSGTRLVRAPKHSLNLGAGWTIPFGTDASLVLRGDYAVLSRFFFEPGEGNAQFGNTLPLTVEPSYSTLDLRATLNYGNYRISAFMNNATDEYYRRTVLAAPGQLISYPAPPRTYGVSVRWAY